MRTHKFYKAHLNRTSLESLPRVAIFNSAGLRLETGGNGMIHRYEKNFKDKKKINQCEEWNEEDEGEGERWSSEGCSLKTMLESRNV